MRRPNLALSVSTSLAAIGLSAWFALAQQSPAPPPGGASTSNPSPPSGSGSGPAAAVDPAMAGRPTRYLLRNAQDYLAYREYARALTFFRAVEARQAELGPDDLAALKRGIGEARRGLGEAINAPRVVAQGQPSGRTTVQPGAFALAKTDAPVQRAGAVAELPPLPAASTPPAELPGPGPGPSADSGLSSTPVMIAVPDLPPPMPRNPDPPSNAGAPVFGARANPRRGDDRAPELLPIAESTPTPAPTPVPAVAPAETVAIPPSLPEPARSPVSDPQATPARAPAPLELPPPAMPDEPATAPTPAAPPALIPDPAPAPVLDPSTPTAPAIELPPIESPPASAPAPSETLPTLPAEPTQRPAPAPTVLPAVPGPARYVDPSAGPQYLRVADASGPDSDTGPKRAEPARPAADPLPAAPVTNPVPEPVPAPEASVLSLPTIPSARPTGIPETVPNSLLSPRLRGELDRIAQRPSGERLPGTMPGDASTDPNTPPMPPQSSTRLIIPRAPSPTEGRPLRQVKMPEDFVSLGDRRWDANRKYWAPAGTCHMILYFQDPVLERYGQGVEQALGPWGRYFSYPLDDPKQSNQRNQILQPFWSMGKFCFQIGTLPYKVVVDPPWEAEYDLGYYRPGDRIPPDTIMITPYGVGPPLKGARY